MGGEVANYLLEILQDGFDRFYWKELYRGDDKKEVEALLEICKNKVVRVTYGVGSQ